MKIKSTFIVWATAIMMLGLLASSVSDAGFFVGAGGGYFHSSFNNKVVIKSTGKRYSNSDNSATVNGKLMAGYSWNIKKYYLGLLANYTLDNDSHVHRGKSTHHSEDDFKLNEGVGVLLGYHCWRHWMPFVYAGYQSADYHHSSTNINTGERRGHTERLNGAQVGLGVSYLFNKHVSIGLNYAYAYYGCDLVGGRSAVAPVRKSVRPIVNQVTLDAFYHFG